MNAIIPSIMEIFESEKITPEEAKKFRSIAEKPIMAFLAPMPTKVAARISDLIGQGKVEVRNGFDATRDGHLLSSFGLHFDVRGINEIAEHPSKLPDSLQGVVGGCGPGYLSKLGGVSYDPGTSMMNRAPGSEAKMPYIVGQLKKGQQFDCSETQVIYSDCVRIIDDLATRLTKLNPGPTP
ncbi:MAG: hypothetical protein WCD70_17135 [Alphaproteobacteria bacterium]